MYLILILKVCIILTIVIVDSILDTKITYYLLVNSNSISVFRLNVSEFDTFVRAVNIELIISF